MVHKTIRHEITFDEISSWNLLISGEELDSGTIGHGARHLCQITLFEE